MSGSTDFERRIGGTFQFRLRTMLLTVTLCGAACAVAQAIGPLLSVVFGLFFLLVALHVVGNAIGTKLREEATANAELYATERPNFPMLIEGPPRAKPLALRTPLGRWIAAATIIGLAGGGSLGETLFFGNASPSALVVGTISSAVIGGFVAFLASSFLSVGIAAAWQAHCDKPAM
jgi:hypothetical protein